MTTSGRPGCMGMYFIDPKPPQPVLAGGEPELTAEDMQLAIAMAKEFLARSDKGEKVFTEDYRSSFSGEHVWRKFKEIVEGSLLQRVQCYLVEDRPDETV